MKNFFKKLSFVLASAMVITSLYAPANAEAASNFVRVKGSKKAVTSKDIFVGGRKVNFDYTIGKKMTGIHGTWTSSDTSVAVVDKKTGVVKAVSNGTATITFKTKKTKSMKKVVTIKTTVNTFTRAKAVELSTATAEVKLGESLDVTASLISIDKAGSSNSTYNLVASSSDEKIATAKVDGTTISISPIATGSATLTVFARHKNGDKYDTPKVELTVTVIGALEAKQVKANKVLVKGSNLSDKVADYDVKDSKGNALKFKETVALNTEKTEATLEFETAQIPVEKYTVTFEKATAEFEVEKAKVARIEITPENEAVLDATVNSKARAFYSVYNQFDEDVTNTALAANIKVTGSGTEEKRGIIQFNQNSDFIPGMSKVVVSVTDSLSGINKTATLTISNKARASEIEYYGIWDKATRTKVDSIQDDATIENYLLLFNTKDQYGLGAYYKDVEKDLSVTLMTVTGYSTYDGSVEEINGKPYVAYKLKKASDTRDGEVTINAIALYGGKSQQSKFNITPYQKVKKLVITEGSLGVYDGQENDLAFTAYDQNDKIITDWKVLKRLNNSKYLTGYNGLAGRIRFEKRDDKKVYLVYNLSGANKLDVAENTTSYQSIGSRTETDEFANVLINVRARRKPVGIVGLKNDVAVGVTRGNELTVAIKNLKFEDQYGNAMSGQDIIDLQLDKKYKVRTEFAVDASDVSNSAGAQYPLEHVFQSKNAFSAGTYFESEFNTTNKDAILDDKQAAGQALRVVANNAGSGNTGALVNSAAVTDKLSYSEKVTVTLYQDAKELGKFKFDIYNVRLDDVKNFAIKDIGLQPISKDATKKDQAILAGAALDASNANPKNFTPEVSGMYAGQKISLVPTKAAQGASVADFVIFGSDDEYVPVNEVAVLEALKKDTHEDTVTVIIKNSEGTRVSKTYNYSRTGRTPAKIEFKPGVSSLDLTAGSSTDWSALKANFVLKDQYGKVLDWANQDPYITVSDNTDLVKVVGNGLKTASITLVSDTNPEAVTLTLHIPGTSAKFEKVVKIH